MKETRTRRSKLGRLSLGARRSKNRRKQETPEERVARLEKMKAATAQKRAKETPEERDARLSRGRRSAAKRRHRKEAIAAREHREAVLAKITEAKDREFFRFLDTMTSEAFEVQADPFLDVPNTTPTYEITSNAGTDEATSSEEVV